MINEGGIEGHIGQDARTPEEIKIEKILTELAGLLPKRIGGSDSSYQIDEGERKLFTKPLLNHSERIGILEEFLKAKREKIEGFNNDKEREAYRRTIGHEFNVIMLKFFQEDREEKPKRFGMF